MTIPNWFDVDRKGLAKLIERRGKVSLIFELVSNALDADHASHVEVKLDPEEGAPKVWVTVRDDAPDGFADLRHAWTLFAESNRKADASKRGRFNLGEKLVIALCEEAMITTTTGGVQFDHRGRTPIRSKRERGSEFIGLAKITRAELAEIEADLAKIITPAGVSLSVNGRTISGRTPLKVVTATLPTEIADAEGIIRRSARQCEVSIYETKPGETAMLYELGIPVVETGDKWHVDVHQKVPLNMDRDNVTPAYLREVRTLVVNELHDKLTEADASATFVSEALADEDATPGAVQRALDLRYGKKRAIWDPSDPEANMNLVAQGYTLIKGSQLTKEQWGNVKKHEAARPAGQIAPTKHAEFSPDGEDVWIPAAKYTDGMNRVVAYAQDLGRELLDRAIGVGILSDIRLSYGACFGSQGLVFNLGRLGHKFFDRPLPNREVNELLIHEFAHAIESNHLDERYHEACCRLGAKMVDLALDPNKVHLFNR